MHTERPLNGIWELAPDAENVGEAERWFVDFPDQIVVRQDLPAAWQHVIPDNGPDVVWYRRRESLDRPLELGERLWLRFESVATDCRAWINGAEVGAHSGNWVPFAFEITEALVGATELEIVLRVDRVRPGPVREVNGHPQQGGHITKGFHDVLSMQVGGVWGEVRLERTGSLCVKPGGLWVAADVRTSEVRVEVELEPDHNGGILEVRIEDPDGHEVAGGSVEIDPDFASRAMTLEVEHVRRWSPDAPAMYRAVVQLSVGSQTSQRLNETFGFRRVEVSADGQRILLNGEPVFISGILDWGHEPRHIAPAPTREELVARFSTLKRMGFNCVCVCMWYPPRSFYDAADQMGMLIWQEHPVWKSDMADDRVEEYKRQFTRFFRRDRNHPSVAIVSGSCEHEEFNQRLGAWWWEQAKHLLSDRLVQIQTAFLEWTDLSKTDLYDEHTYEGSGRWVAYLRDLDRALAEREPKPMVMGESVMYSSWLDVAAYDRLGSRPWWVPPGLDSVRALNAQVDALDGQGASADILAMGVRYNEAGRKFQTELVRMFPRNAGLVANGMRDVPLCPCGVLDDFDQCKFEPDSVRAWMGPVVLLLRTPEMRRGFTSGRMLTIELGASNYGRDDIDAAMQVSMRIGEEEGRTFGVPVQAGRGKVRLTPTQIELPGVDRPTPMHVNAKLGAFSNAWTIWLLPESQAAPQGTVTLTGLAFTEAEKELAFEERKYSSGWGLPNRTWKPRNPEPGLLLSDAAGWGGNADPGPGTRVMVTHRLNAHVLDWLERGGRVLHLPSKAKDGLPTKFITGFGQVPWIRPQGPLARFGRDWIEGLLDYDLMRSWTRVLPTGELGWNDRLEPYVRMLYTHDMANKIPVYDALAAARVGEGVLAVCCLDLHDEPGQLLLREIVAWLDAGERMPERQLELAAVRQAVNRE